MNNLGPQVGRMKNMIVTVKNQFHLWQIEDVHELCLLCGGEVIVAIRIDMHHDNGGQGVCLNSLVQPPQINPSIGMEIQGVVVKDDELIAEGSENHIKRTENTLVDFFAVSQGVVVTDNDDVRNREAFDPVHKKVVLEVVTLVGEIADMHDKVGRLRIDDLYCSFKIIIVLMTV